GGGARPGPPPPPAAPPPPPPRAPPPLARVRAPAPAWPFGHRQPLGLDPRVPGRLSHPSPPPVDFHGEMVAGGGRTAQHASVPRSSWAWADTQPGRVLDRRGPNPVRDGGPPPPPPGAPAL